MRRTLFMFVWLAISATAYTAEQESMWSCALVGERRSTLFLADRGSRSYVQFAGQRIPARLTATDSEKKWTFGANFVVLTDDSIADYHERGTLQAKFKCELMQ